MQTIRNATTLERTYLSICLSERNQINASIRIAQSRSLQTRSYELTRKPIHEGRAVDGRLDVGEDTINDDADCQEEKRWSIQKGLGL